MSIVPAPHTRNKIGTCQAGGAGRGFTVRVDKRVEVDADLGQSAVEETPLQQRRVQRERGQRQRVADHPVRQRKGRERSGVERRLDNALTALVQIAGDDKDVAPAAASAATSAE